MFTINIYLRFALIAIFLIGGIIVTPILGFIWSWLPILIGIALLIGYVLLGTVQSASMLVQQDMDFIAAEKRLNLTLNPKWLYVSNRAYYYIMKGTIQSQLYKDHEKAEEYLNIANNMELPTDNEKAAVKLQLAGIAANRQKWNQAKLLHRDLKALKVSEPQLKEQIAEFGKALSQSGQMKSAQRMGAGSRNKGMVMRPGGKRRRPKMR